MALALPESLPDCSASPVICPGVTVTVMRTTGQVAYERLLNDLKNSVPNCDVFSSTDISHYPALMAKKALANYVPQNAAGLAPAALCARVRGSDRWWSAFGIPYIGVSCVALIWLRDDGGAGMTLIYFLLLSVWANDTGAFVVGRAIGGPRLAPSISPAKTWAGFWGGIVIAGAALGGVALTAGAHSPLVASALAAMLAVMSNVGDLFESAVKRRYKVKDSGGIIPGHGGVLDRIDGLLAAAPVLALFHWLIGAQLGWW